MKDNDHVLFRGEIWFPHPGSMCTKTKLASVEKYIGTRASNLSKGSLILDNMAFLTSALSDPRCALVPQLKLDIDAIEVILLTSSK
jgi:hypothetical protein